MPELKKIWDDNRLEESDLSNPYEMTRFLEQHFAPSASDEAVTTILEISGRRCRSKA